MRVRPYLGFVPVPSDEPARLTLLKHSQGLCRGAVDTERQGSGEGKRLIVPSRDDAVVGRLDGRDRPSVVKSRFELDLEVKSPVGAGHLSEESSVRNALITDCIRDGHEVRQRRLAGRRLEPRFEDVRSGNVSLCRGERASRLDGEVPPSLGVEDTREDARVLDVREATPVD